MPRSLKKGPYIDPNLIKKVERNSLSKKKQVIQTKVLEPVKPGRYPVSRAVDRKQLRCQCENSCAKQLRH